MFVTPAWWKHKLSIETDTQHAPQAPTAEAVCEWLQPVVVVLAVNQLTHVVYNVVSTDQIRLCMHIVYNTE